MKQYAQHGHTALAATNRRHRLLCEELSAWFAQQACAEVGKPAQLARVGLGLAILVAPED